MFRFTIRGLLLLTAVVALTLALSLQHYARMERLARLHARQAQLVAQHRGFLLSASFDVPQQAWNELDRQEQAHQQLASEYRQKIWRPWLQVTQLSPPLTIQVESTAE